MRSESYSANAFSARATTSARARRLRGIEHRIAPRLPRRVRPARRRAEQPAVEERALVRPRVGVGVADLQVAVQREAAARPHPHVLLVHEHLAERVALDRAVVPGRRRGPRIAILGRPVAKAAAAVGVGERGVQRVALEPARVRGAKAREPLAQLRRDPLRTPRRPPRGSRRRRAGDSPRTLDTERARSRRRPRARAASAPRCCRGSARRSCRRRATGCCASSTLRPELDAGEAERAHVLVEAPGGARGRRAAPMSSSGSDGNDTSWIASKRRFLPRRSSRSRKTRA